MNDQETLNGYVYRQLQSGLQPEEITQQLRTAGWNEAAIARSFDAARTSLTPTAPTAPNPVTAPLVSFTPTGQKRGRIKTGWLLFKQSLKVLWHNKQLIRYPLIGGLLSLLLTIIVVAIVLLSGSTFIVSGVDSAGKTVDSLTGYGVILGIVYYVIVFFVIFLYNAGLTAHVLDIFRGTSKSYKYYMQIAWSKRVPIFFYALITTTVGYILRLIEERFSLLGFIIRRIFGVMWTLANLFTIPVIVETNSSAPSAIKQSTKLFLSRWGENIVARISFSGLAFLFYILIMIPVSIILLIISGVLGVFGVLFMLFVIFLSFILFAVVQTSAESVLSTALYFYAQYAQIPGAYDPALLNAAFVPKKAKK